jgi:hypothetical protein
MIIFLKRENKISKVPYYGDKCKNVCKFLSILKEKEDEISLAKQCLMIIFRVFSSGLLDFKRLIKKNKWLHFDARSFFSPKGIIEEWFIFDLINNE